LVHDHVLLRQGLRRLLEDEPDLEVVCEAGNVVECMRDVFQFRPHVVIADITTFGLPIQEVQLLLARESFGIKLVLLSMDKGSNLTNTRPWFDFARSAARHTSVEELVHMVRSVCGDRFRSEKDGLRHHLTNSEESWDSGPMADLNSPGKSSTDAGTLTTREREILKLLAEGKTVRAAATTLGLSSKTVDAHKFNLMRKLGIHNKAELVMWAIQQRVVRVPAPLGN
jgi:DNA-binding NarL/FixJ family response regulator